MPRAQPLTALDRAIAEAGLRKNWIADRLGVHPSTLSKWLSGERIVPEDHRLRLALLLRRDRDDLFVSANCAEASLHTRAA